MSITKAIDSFYPLRKRNANMGQRYETLWWSVEVEKAVNGRNRSRRKAQRTIRLRDVVEFERVRKETKYIVVKAMMDYWKQKNFSSNIELIHYKMRTNGVSPNRRSSLTTERKSKRMKR